MFCATKILYSTNIHYPSLLRQIYNFPTKLYYKGKIELLDKLCISIVGTRKMSDYGEEMTRKIIDELSVLDVCIVSGLASGIDTIAHQTALEFGLTTIAVLGSGIENIYPTGNLELAELISERGLIISEYEGYCAPKKTNFPQRNRIVSGLSIATILVEAPEKSGALITTKLALEQGREIFVVPGDIDRKNSIGPLKLLQNGEAYPISCGQDVIDILQQQPRLFPSLQNIKTEKHLPRHSTPRPISLPYNLSPEHQKIISFIPEHRGIDFEKLAGKAQIPVRDLLAGLSFLEIKKLISTKGGKYCRNC